MQAKGSATLLLTCGEFTTIAGNPFTRVRLIAFFSRNRYAPQRILIGAALIAYTAAFIFLSPENQAGLVEFTGYTNMVTRTKQGTVVTNRFATFTIQNVGQRALTYAGTPLPVYQVEHLHAGGWRVLGELVQADNLATLLPGERIDFRVYLPETTNNWRIAVPCLRPSKIPYPFKRFFSPTFYSISSGELLPSRESSVQLADITNRISKVGEHLTK